MKSVLYITDHFMANGFLILFLLQLRQRLFLAHLPSASNLDHILFMALLPLDSFNQLQVFTRLVPHRYPNQAQNRSKYFSVHWAWSNGWLVYPPDSAGLPPDVWYRDYAGGGNVHAVGGMAALVGAIFIGPRIGRFEKVNEEE